MDIYATIAPDNKYNMRKISFLDAVVANTLLEEQKDNRRKQELVGKLSGSILGNTLQSQVLHMIGVPDSEIEEFVLRKFQRGHHVEAWILTHIPGLIDTTDEKQHSVEYRGATGHVDALVDMKEWNMPELGIIPHEVKSIANAAYAWMFGAKAKHNAEGNKAKWGHQLQAGMYALALNADHFMIHYIAADDYRIESFLYETSEIAEDVDRIIDEVIEQLSTGRVPVFTARQDWQNKPDYQNYKAWVDLGEDEAQEKLKKKYPKCYERLQFYAKSLSE